MASQVSPIGDLVKAFFEKLESEKKITREDILEVWKEIVGEAAFKHSRPAALRKEILMVFVDSSAWLQELQMRKRQILKGLKSKVGRDKISEIHFKIGEY